ncbi:MAG TPA: hypothetical protein VNV82_17705 [Bryobacteraceae bacterium]|jgi:hypothetical protein|nr:hypothetical protein [Bryobacteraceae bacterium]
MSMLTWGRLALPVVLLLSGCSEAPKTGETTKAPEKPPEPLTGRQAFQMMYPQARGWAPDAQPLELRSINLSQVKPEKGKAGGWQAIFVSPSLGKSRTYTYSAVEAEGNLHQGVFAGIAEDYAVGRGATSPFLPAALKIDSDEAYDTAAAKSQDYIKKNPDKVISYLLEQNKRFPDPTWRVIWGESVSSSDYSVFVDATTGMLLEKMH